MFQRAKRFFATRSTTRVSTPSLCPWVVYGIEGLVLTLLLLISVIVCVPVTIVLYRRVGFTHPWKAAFALSAPLVFIAAMVFNLWLVETCAPWLFKATSRHHPQLRLHLSERKEWQPTRKSQNLWRSQLSFLAAT